MQYWKYWIRKDYYPRRKLKMENEHTKHESSESRADEVLEHCVKDAAKKLRDAFK
jgi:hypothetical protein